MGDTIRKKKPTQKLQSFTTPVAPPEGATIALLAQLVSLQNDVETGRLTLLDALTAAYTLGRPGKETR
jgi:hypothetical protein